MIGSGKSRGDDGAGGAGGQPSSVLPMQQMQSSSPDRIRRFAVVRGQLIDIAVAAFLLFHVLIVALAVDAASTGTAEDDREPRRWASLWIGVINSAILSYSFYRSFSYIGDASALTHSPETIFGVFAEIVSITFCFGPLFCAARTWSAASDSPFHSKSFLHNSFDSVFEMSLVQAGVGFTGNDVPTTSLEKLAAWGAAFVGGTLITNLLLLSTVFSRRAWFSRVELDTFAVEEQTPLKVSEQINAHLGRMRARR